MTSTVFTNIDQRITPDEALDLLVNRDLLEIGALAEQMKLRFHKPDQPVTFVIDRNINYTNICNVDCKFCSFYRHAEDEDAYTLTYEQIKPKIQELVDIGGTQALIQGGVNPDLPFEYYTDLLREIRRDYPDLTIHAFSPTEIAYMVKITGWSLKTVLEKLVEAGLSSIPGAGAEVLDDWVRDRVSPKKVDALGWLDVMEGAHEIGLKTTATMMFGMVDQPQHLVNHLFKLRDLQDKTGGFTAFIPWTFQPAGTALAKLPKTATGVDFLKVLALSRIVLDNIPNIQSSYITQGVKLCQTGLFFGANDVGGILMEENVVTSAGVPIQGVDTLLKMIHNIGRDAAQRDTYYNILKIHPKEDSKYFQRNQVASAHV